MAYRLWPATLPQYVLESGFSDGAPDQLLQTGMDAGRVKSRRRYTTANRQFTCSVAMTQAQKAIFIDWYDNILLGGSIPFTWVLPVERTPANFMFRTPVPKWSVRGNAHIVSFAMERVA